MKKKINLEEEIEELKSRIKILEDKERGHPHCNHPKNPNLHYHGHIPCTSNPCTWC